MPENNIQTSNISQYKTVSTKKANEFRQEVKSKEQNQEKKIDTKKLAVSLGAAIGITAVILGGIHLARKGKAKQALEGLHSAASEAAKPSDTLNSEPAKQVINTVKTFFDSAGKQVEGVKLLKGKAVSSDGSMFSGAMETFTKSGKKVNIEYLDGFMTKSSVNDKLFKTFEPIKDVAKSSAQKITQFNSEGNVVSASVHSYFDNGKLKRFYRVLVPDEIVSKVPNSQVALHDLQAEAADFSKNGKILSKSIYSRPYELKKAEIFNEQGELIRKISGPFDEIYEGGKLKKRAHINKNYLANTNDRFLQSDFDIKLHTPEIEFFADDGKTVNKLYRYSNPGDMEFSKGQSSFQIINFGEGGKRTLFGCLDDTTVDLEAQILKDGTIEFQKTPSKQGLEKIIGLMRDMVETGKQEQPDYLSDFYRIEKSSGLPEMINQLEQHAKTM